MLCIMQSTGRCNNSFFTKPQLRPPRCCEMQKRTLVDTPTFSQPNPPPYPLQQSAQGKHTVFAPFPPALRLHMGRANLCHFSTVSRSAFLAGKRAFGAGTLMSSDHLAGCCLLQPDFSVGQMKPHRQHQHGQKLFYSLNPQHCIDRFARGAGRAVFMSPLLYSASLALLLFFLFTHQSLTRQTSHTKKAELRPPIPVTQPPPFFTVRVASETRK